MDIWMKYRNLHGGKELTSLPEYAQVAAEVVDTLESQGLGEIPILRVLDLARRSVIIKTEIRIEKAIRE